jgi:hypothetical protein
MKTRHSGTALKKFKKDELIAVDWVDTAANPTGSTDNASPVPRRTVGIMVGVRRKEFQREDRPRHKATRRVLVMTDTSDSDVAGQEGWTAIPLANVLSMTGLVLTKKRWTS